MLYLMRKIGESIVINGDIEVRVVEVKGRAVKLGFEFPATSTVLRKEIHDRIIEENRAAAVGLNADDIASAMSGITVEATVKTPSPKMPEVTIKPKSRPIKDT